MFSETARCCGMSGWTSAPPMTTTSAAYTVFTLIITVELRISATVMIVGVAAYRPLLLSNNSSSHKRIDSSSPCNSFFFFVLFFFSIQPFRSPILIFSSALPWIGISIRNKTCTMANTWNNELEKKNNNNNNKIGDVVCGRNEWCYEASANNTMAVFTDRLKI